MIRAARPDSARFPATRWSLVIAAQAGAGTDVARRALAELAEMYRAPVEAFLVASGYPEAAAAELAARFLASLNEREDFASVTRGRGRFRPWLRRALREFVSEQPEPPAFSGVRDAGSETPLERADEAEPGGLRDSRRCAQCGADTSGVSVLGCCGACLLARTLRPVPELEEDPKHIGDYEIVGERLGTGGESEVYRARLPGADRDVALKILRAEYAHVPERVERFRRAVRMAGKLEHPRIVRVYDRAGLASERPFYTMQLVAGGTLAERVERFREPRRAAGLMIKIARAVQHAHQHGILHRDLKPENVLIDIDGEPYLSDFMAKSIARKGPDTIAGTCGYMAPEQSAGKGVTIAADVYGLGAIFYELLTGRPPVDAASLEEVQRFHESSEPVPPRRIVPSVDPDLEAVCLAALAKDPVDRHRTAALFADSLECVLHGRAPRWPESSLRRKLWLWTRRHPWLAIAALAGVVALLFADVATLTSVRSEQRELVNAALRHNAALASAQARAVLALFEKCSDQTARAAFDPAVREITERGALVESAPGLRLVLERSREFNSVAVFDTAGRMLSRYPRPPEGYTGRSYDFRDYYACGRTLGMEGDAVRDAPFLRAPEACLSNPYRGEISRAIEYAFAAPVYREDRTWAGIVIFSRHANRTLGEIEITDTYRTGQETAMFGWRGRDRGDPPLGNARPKLTVVAHPELHDTDEHALSRKLTDRLVERFGNADPARNRARSMRPRPLEDADYVDPVSGERKLAGFAPVGASGYIVAVASPREKALGANQRHIDALFRSVGLLNLGFLIVAIVAIWATLREPRWEPTRDE